jgi:hypothetical protein
MTIKGSWRAQFFSWCQFFLSTVCQFFSSTLLLHGVGTGFPHRKSPHHTKASIPWHSRNIRAAMRPMHRRDVRRDDGVSLVPHPAPPPHQQPKQHNRVIYLACRYKQYQHGLHDRTRVLQGRGQLAGMHDTGGAPTSPAITRPCTRCKCWQQTAHQLLQQGCWRWLRGAPPRPQYTDCAGEHTQMGIRGSLKGGSEGRCCSSSGPCDVGAETRCPAWHGSSHLIAVALPCLQLLDKIMQRNNR